MENWYKQINIQSYMDISEGSNPRQPQPIQCKHWCFTLDNFTQEEIKLIERDFPIILIQKLFGTHNFLLYLLNFFELYNHWIYNFNLNKQIYS